MVQIRVSTNSRGYWLDGAHEISKASRAVGVQITTWQVRTLQALALGSCDRPTLQKRCGFVRKRVPPHKWVLQLRDLTARGLVRAEELEATRGWMGKSLYHATAEGRRVLRLATEAARNTGKPSDDLKALSPGSTQNRPL